jgi:hypothetical protein
MRIHTKILRKPLNKIVIKALEFLDELKVSQSPQAGMFRYSICPAVVFPAGEGEYSFLNFRCSGFPFSLRTEKATFM